MLFAYGFKLAIKKLRQVIFVKIPELSTNSFHFPSVHLGKIGIALGSVCLGQWVLTDVVHIPGAAISVLVLGTGAWWLAKPVKTVFNSPTSVKGWIDRCRKVIDQFEILEDGQNVLKLKNDRSNILDSTINRQDRQIISFIGFPEEYLTHKLEIEEFFVNYKSLDLKWEKSLPTTDMSWVLPDYINISDLLIYNLSLPLKASDLLWLRKLPVQQPTWLIVASSNQVELDDQLSELQAQLPSSLNDKILSFNGSDKEFSRTLSPIARVLDHPKNLMDLTTQRMLEKLHSSWQSELEVLRREKFSDIQQRTQWIVAGAVFASPVPSTDLLSIAVVNGLMIQEMARIWSCSWKPEVLQVVARQLVGAALAQGIVEWSGQALLGVAKFHGGSWLAAGALQALSAAYLTRVVGRSMADWMALNNGVEQCDLEALKIQAPQIVAEAAEQEKRNWTSFLTQATKWDPNNHKMASSAANV